MSAQNPFERYDLDPHEGPRAITARLRELAEDAPDEATRSEIRAAWEELTLHPARRLAAALRAHPETRPPLGSPPAHDVSPPPADPTLADLAPRPFVAAALASSRARSEHASRSLDDDPILRRLPDVR